MNFFKKLFKNISTSLGVYTTDEKLAAVDTKSNDYDLRYHAAFDVCWRKFGGYCIEGETKLDGYEAEIKNMKEWVKGLNPTDRKAYLVWLNHFSKNIADRRVELRQQRERDEFLKSGNFPKPQ